jgi:hypothetical protein
VILTILETLCARGILPELNRRRFSGLVGAARAGGRHPYRVWCHRRSQITDREDLLQTDNGGDARQTAAIINGNRGIGHDHNRAILRCRPDATFRRVDVVEELLVGV